MTRRPCRKADPNWPWPCSCDDCSRAAARAWTRDMGHVHADELTVREANARADTREHRLDP